MAYISYDVFPRYFSNVLVGTIIIYCVYQKKKDILNIHLKSERINISSQKIG